MAIEQGFVDYVLDQAGEALGLSSRMMFGGCTIYLDGKVVALVCDNQLFIKPTPEGRAILKTVTEHPPYPGAKPCFLIGDELEDPDLLRSVFRATASALPAPKPKSPRKKASQRKK